MFAEFGKYQVLPLDASVATRLVSPRPSLVGGPHRASPTSRRSPAFRTARRPRCSTRPTRSRPISTCRRRAPKACIVTEGGRFGGFGLYLLKGKPVFTWNLLDLKRIKWEGTAALAPGKHTDRVRLQV